ncbi:hypothetical protein F5Y18DRAFT_380842 [Xylariaceae sp. FL1019]|nr:hypothetical protein F5Y18DRAFT_380842 [Xylariaceae sp. FL1019]
MEMPSRPKTNIRRRRPALACVSCRKSKIRCNRQQPCSACIRSRHKTCVYETGHGPASRASDQHSTTDTENPVEPNAAPVTPDSAESTANHDDAITVPLSRRSGPGDPAPTVPDIDVFLSRLLTDDVPSDKNKNSRPAARAEGGTIASYLSADFHPMSRGVVSKTRYFGQSHWVSGVIQFRAILEVFERQSQNAKSEALQVLTKCKALGRTIKARRSPGIITKFGTNIPSRDVADKLVDAYLRTFESVFRVVHVPTFRREYEQYWVTPDTARTHFVILLQLILCIGATVYDNTFSLRKSAVQWVMEAQYWLLSLPAKGKLTIAGIQIMILITFARGTASVGGDLIWIHVGSLLRSAMYMGLHRDPSRLPPMSRLDAEIRRRLWNTIIEMEIQTSMDAGGFPMVSLDNSDTRAPANLDDSELADVDPSTREKEPTRFTDMSMALALRDSLKERVAVCQLLNVTSYQGAYEDTIHLHGRFSKAWKSLVAKLKSFPPSGRQPSSFTMRFLEILMRRYFLALHLPYLAVGSAEPAFAFSRNTVIESATKIYTAVFPTAAQIRVCQDDELEGMAQGDDLVRLVVCSAGFWRSIMGQTAMTIALELHQQCMLEEEGMGRPTLRPDLLNILHHSLALFLSRIKAGETNVKGYLFSIAIVTSVDSLMVGQKDIDNMVLDAALLTEKKCLALLKEHAGLTDPTETSTGVEQFDWENSMAIDEGWDSSMPSMGSLFEVTGVESFLGADSDFEFMTPMPFWGRN